MKQEIVDEVFSNLAPILSEMCIEHFNKYLEEVGEESIVEECEQFAMHNIPMMVFTEVLTAFLNLDNPSGTAIDAQLALSKSVKEASAKMEEFCSSVISDQRKDLL
jgi:hypothetical protein